MITRFHVENYKALRDVTVELTRLHVLIGMNDTGKSSILEALQAMCRSVELPLEEAFGGRWEADALVSRNSTDSVVTLEADVALRVPEAATHSLRYRVRVRFGSRARQVSVVDEALEPDFPSLERKKPDRTNICHTVLNVHDPRTDDLGILRRALHDELKGVRSYRWDPSMLALPNTPQSSTSGGMLNTGFGLAAVLVDILHSDRPAFDRLEAEFRSFFPHVEAIKLPNQAGYRAAQSGQRDAVVLQEHPGYGIWFAMRGEGRDIPASQVSDGLLVVLACLALAHSPNPPRLILLEEPETGIHPQRLKEVIELLRRVTERPGGPQILMTTHSPYALDFFQPNEVTLCVRDETDGVQVHNLRDSGAVRGKQSIFTLGEIWTLLGDDVLAGNVSEPDAESEHE